MNGLMTATLVQLFLHALDEAPTIVDDARKLFDVIATRQGGLQKLSGAAAAFAQLAGHASGAVVQAASDVGKAIPAPAANPPQTYVPPPAPTSAASAPAVPAPAAAPANPEVSPADDPTVVLNAADRAALAAQGNGNGNNVS